MNEERKTPRDYGAAVKAYKEKSAERALDKVVVMGVRMSFLEMVVFMVKWAVASIPAAIVLTLAWAVAWFIVAMALGAMA